MAIRMNENQFKMFQENQRNPSSGPRKPAGQPRAKKRKDELPENILEEQIKGFLAIRGWTVTRNHVGRYIPLYVVMQAAETHRVIQVKELGGRIVTIGTKGQCDYTASRPRPDLGFGMHQRCHIETKAPGKTPSPEQKEWIRQRNALGEPSAWFDDYEGDWDTSFVPWYRTHFGE